MLGRMGLRVPRAEPVRTYLRGVWRHRDASRLARIRSYLTFRKPPHTEYPKSILLHSVYHGRKENIPHGLALGHPRRHMALSGREELPVTMQHVQIISTTLNKT
jgi:hypothetical protein